MLLSAPVTNMALELPESQSSCSSEIDTFGAFKCKYATDGKTHADLHTSWASSKEGDGAWHRITFLGPVLVTHAIIWNPCREDTQFETLTFSFSDGTSLQVF